MSSLNDRLIELVGQAVGSFTDAAWVVERLRTSRLQGDDTLKNLAVALDDEGVRLQEELDNLTNQPTGSWNPHPDYPHADWRYEVDNGDTLLGYWDWVECQIELAEVENDD